MTKKQLLRFSSTAAAFILFAVMLGCARKVMVVIDLKRTTPLEVGIFSRIKIFEYSGSRIVVTVLNLENEILDHLIGEYSMKPLLAEKKSIFFWANFNEIGSWEFEHPDLVWIASGSRGLTHWETAIDKSGRSQKILVQYDY